MIKLIFIFFILFAINLNSEEFIITHVEFIKTRERLAKYSEEENVLIIASPGRSGSTLLSSITYYQVKKFRTLKTHLLPPQKNFKGKIIFIFSNPNKATESVFHQMIVKENFAEPHFFNLETSDKTWLKRVGPIKKQNYMTTLFAYDALGIYEQLKQWLYDRTMPCDCCEAQVMAIKYENLWDEEVVSAISEFLMTPKLVLPTKKHRGGWETTELEKQSKQFYNLGSDEDPLYEAYAKAHELWSVAPAFQFLKIR